MMHGTVMNDCPLTMQDVNQAEKMCGEDMATLKSKTTHQKPTPVMEDCMQVPKQTSELHNEVALAADTMFVQKIPFFISASRDIKFTTVEVLKNRKISGIMDCMARAFNTCNRQGFAMTTALMDMEFEPLRDQPDDGDVTLNCAAAGEHVPEIERQI